MINTKMICDRCGKECENNRSNRGFHIFRNKFILTTNENEYLDLCQGCYDSLAKWFKNIEQQKNKDGN